MRFLIGFMLAVLTAFCGTALAVPLDSSDVTAGLMAAGSVILPDSSQPGYIFFTDRFDQRGIVNLDDGGIVYRFWFNETDMPTDEDMAFLNEHNAGLHWLANHEANEVGAVALLKDNLTADEFAAAAEYVSMTVYVYNNIDKPEVQEFVYSL